MDYTQLIERMNAAIDENAFEETNTALQYGIAAIEALQAKVVELDRDTADLAMLADQYKAERDAALAKLAALEGDQDHNAGEVVGFTDEYVLVEFPCEGNTVNIEEGMLLYPHPVIAAGAQPDTALEYMTGYSDGKAWAEGQPAKPVEQKIGCVQHDCAECIARRDAKSVELSDEQDRALCEAYCNDASDEYFKARPKLDSDVNRRIFYAGHRKAWLAAAAKERT